MCMIAIAAKSYRFKLIYATGVWRLLHIHLDVITYIKSTMGNIKAKTHLEKLGFSETDKKKPTHDIIQTWVYNNIEPIIKENIFFNHKYPYKIIRNKWEHEIFNSNNNYKLLIGFVDIMVEVYGEFEYYHDREILKDNMSKKIYIEVKTEIPSLGELIRQMRAYQAYTISSDSYYMVISPDDRHTKILNEQGFYFYKSKDPSLLF